MKFQKVWFGPRLASSISWASWAGPFLKTADLSRAGPDLKNRELSLSAQLAQLAHQIYNSGLERLGLEPRIENLAHRRRRHFVQKREVPVELFSQFVPLLAGLKVLGEAGMLVSRHRRH